MWMVALVAALGAGQWVLAAKPADKPANNSKNGVFSLFGEASIVKSQSPPKKWVVELVSLDYRETDDFFAGISFQIPDDLQLDELTNLSASYEVVEGTLGGGSPRFVIGVDTDGDGEADGNIFAYLGTPPNYDDEPSGQVDSGNLLLQPVDATQVGGAFYDDFANVAAQLGDATIVSIDLVADGGWATEDGLQVVDVNQVQINNTNYCPNGSDKK
jgi:hypothetical protein